MLLLNILSEIKMCIKIRCAKEGYCTSVVWLLPPEKRLSINAGFIAFQYSGFHPGETTIHKCRRHFLQIARVPSRESGSPILPTPEWVAL
jgi:hypothetical protein